MSQSQKPEQPQNIHTEGGASITGDVHTSGGAFIGRDFIQHITQFFTGDSEAQRDLRNRRAMLRLVRNTWIKGVLERSLHGAAMIELGKEYHPDAVERPWDLELHLPDQERRPVPPGTPILELFDQCSGALLILGEPGSGKTTTLLELCRAAIAHAEQDPTQPVPLVLKLSSWVEKQLLLKCARKIPVLGPMISGLFGDSFEVFEEWLLDEVSSKYSISKKITRLWIKNGNLFLLLDGLDEIRLERRSVCVEAINTFRKEYGLMPLAVCSRVADYEALKSGLSLQGAILIQPLTQEQIEQYLEGTNTDFRAVRRILQRDPELQDLARSPLMLSIMTLAYQGISVKALGSPDSNEPRRRQLFDAYVQQMFKRRMVDQSYSPAQTIAWLAWLARRMSSQSQSVFLIHEIQPGFLDTEIQKQLYSILWHGVSGPIIGLCLGLVAGLVCDPPTKGVPVGLIGGLILGLFFGLIAAPGRIEPVRMVWQALPEQSPRYLLNALVMGGVSGLVFGLSFGRMAVPIAGSSYGRMAGPIAGSFYGFSVGLIVALYFGGFTAIQNVTLRFILWFFEHIPWDFTHFLDYCVGRIFLHRVGGGYMFIHPLFQEYFASLTPANIERLAAGVEGCRV